MPLSSPIAPTIVNALDQEPGNLPLSGLATIGAGFITPIDGDVVLAKGQTTTSQNGIWVAHSGAWTRHPSYPAGSVYPKGLMVLATNALGTQASVLSGSATVTVGTTGHTWADLPVSNGSISTLQLANLGVTPAKLSAAASAPLYLGAFATFR